jgi:hypothetical protein
MAASHDCMLSAISFNLQNCRKISLLSPLPLFSLIYGKNLFKPIIFCYRPNVSKFDGVCGEIEEISTKRIITFNFMSRNDMLICNCVKNENRICGPSLLSFGMVSNPIK